VAKLGDKGAICRASAESAVYIGDNYLRFLASGSIDLYQEGRVAASARRRRV